ncbi:muscle M-line assembly protein unc-89-like [Ostrea edulis]|uniref:muscle M-line assembly protein unc-89-like n=1 Tax=Ostrea edulis TaxID=37623 RepID=UPI0024AEADC1|nr:muscle M-line assembly protein unc-89-like [Ostrea edulis]
MASKHLVPEQQNFVRLSFACLDEIRVMLGDILHCQIPPEDLFKKIQATTTLLIGNQQLSPEQLKLCYNPCPFVPDYQYFDITLLYKLIRNLCQTLQPSQGWGQKPRKTDIKIGDDIERLRLFRNGMIGHAGSSCVPDGIFASKWSELENIFKRIQGFLSLNGITKNFVEQLVSLKRTDFGWQDHEKSEMRLMFECIKLTAIPKLTVQGDEQKVWGEKACFMARYEDGDTSNNWPITWQKITGNTIKQLDISTERYRGSSSQQLVIPRVSKDDQGEYRATVSREEKGTHIHIPSNTIYLTVTGDLPTLEIENAISEEDRIIIHYNVSVDDQSPAVHSVMWSKDGEHLEKTGDKYSGGQLMDTYLTIHSPTLNDAGQYSCEVSNAVGPDTKSIHLSVPSVSIIEVPEVIVGNPIIIVPTIQSCPTPVSAIWQKNNRHNNEEFERLEINDSKYFGSSDDPDDPRLVMQKVTQEDALYYRLIVSNGIAQSASNTIYLKLIGGVPSLYVHHETHIMENSVTLVCEMTVPNHSPTVSDVFWTKDDRKIDITGNGEKYSGGSIDNPSLTIKTVNSNDVGIYQCCASNSVGEMCSEKIYLGPPSIEFDNPDFDELHKRVTYIATIKSIPVALNAEWKVKQDRNDEFQVIDVQDPLYRGSMITLPRPKLVVNKHKVEQVEPFQLEVFNSIGSSRKNTQDIVVDSHDAIINKEIPVPLMKFYSKRGSNVLFANLSDDLVKSIPENTLDSLKLVLLGLNEVDAESIKELKSVTELLMLLQEHKLFTQTDVIFMQYLLKRAGCQKLYEKCVHYARQQRALCFFEKNPGNICYALDCLRKHHSYNLQTVNEFN